MRRVVQSTGIASRIEAELSRVSRVTDDVLAEEEGPPRTGRYSILRSITSTDSTCDALGFGYRRKYALTQEDHEWS